VLGRVARRIWAVAMRERYGANERSQKLKFHSQTSGRSLHAQEAIFAVPLCPHKMSGFV
jgi:methylmalonyl-CoA mutase